MSPDSVTLVNSKPEDGPIGYQIHLQTVLDRETKNQVQTIAEKHSLALKEENGKVVIYQPKQTIQAVA